MMGIVENLLIKQTISSLEQSEITGEMHLSCDTLNLSL